MDGPMPDPSTLDDGTEQDDDVPLNVVREKAIGERDRSASLRNGSGGGIIAPPQRTRPQDVDLFGDAEETPARPSTTEPAIQRLGPPKAPAAPPKQTKPGESLLGLDFFGGTQSTPARPSSTGATTPGVPGRADLKSSILSLYASKPAAVSQPQPQIQQQQQPQSNMDFFGGIQSPPLTSPVQQQGRAPSMGGLDDAFSSLSFTSPQQSTQQAKASPFSNLTSPTGHSRQTSASKPPSALSGGSFFDIKPTPPPKPTPQPAPVTAPRKESFGGDFGDFSSATISPVTSNRSPLVSAPRQTSGGGMGDLFGLSSPAQAQAPAPPPKPTPAAPAAMSPPPLPQASNYTSSSAFNLSQPTPQPATASKPAQTSNFSNFSSLSNTDAWGSNDAWASPDPPAPAPAPAPIQPIAPIQAQTQTRTNTFKPPAPAPVPAMQTPFDSGWGDNNNNSSTIMSPTKPTTTSTSAGGFSVQQDEEFGGWSHASPVATTPGVGKQGGSGFGGAGAGGGTDDLFGNVWE